MPTLVEYDDVLARMSELRMRCQYFNSGAFSPAPGEPMHFGGWIGPEDVTIRPAAREQARRIAEPYPQTLAGLVGRAWKEIIGGPVWLMPRSSWAFELDFGSKDWLPDALRLAGFDSAILEGRTNAPAVALSQDEFSSAMHLIETALEKLAGSDFALAFPDRPIVCTLHHHKQVWWIGGDADLISRVIALSPE